MSVIIHKEQRGHDAGPDAECILCKGELRPPFLAWDALFICGRFCLEVKRGLMADIVHCAAVEELQGLGCSGVVLARTNQSTLDQEERRQIASDHRIVREFREDPEKAEFARRWWMSHGDGGNNTEVP